VEVRAQGRAEALRSLALRPGDVSALIHYRNGTVRREEFYYGSSFLSQSGRFIEWNDSILSVEVTDAMERKRIATGPGG